MNELKEKIIKRIKFDSLSDKSVILINSLISEIKAKKIKGMEQVLSRLNGVDPKDLRKSEWMLDSALSYLKDGDTIQQLEEIRREYLERKKSV